MNVKLNRRHYVDSLFVSRSYGDSVRIRTYINLGDETSLLAPHGGCWWIGCDICNRGDFYVISVNGRRVVETRRKSTVRAYIMDNDCQRVEKF